MILYPAIDIREGRAVRLVKGDFEQATVYRDLIFFWLWLWKITL